MKLNKFLPGLLLGLLFSSIATGQGSADYGSGLKLDLNHDGSRFIRFMFWNQIWVRSIENNPGTLIGGEPANNSVDIGARRVRTIMYAQLSPRYLILTHLGINNQSFINGGANGTSGTGTNGAGKKPQMFYHDIWNEYAIAPSINPGNGKLNKSSLYLGAGLHYWNGISRMTSASTLNFLMIDAPVFNWPNIDVSDQLIRQFGIYAKGNLGNLHYRVNVNKPFSTNNTPVAGGAAVDNNGNSKASFGGYFDYQFFDQEACTLPFKVGTYLGSKKVFNIGAGFYNNSEGTKSLTLQGDLKKHDINIYAVDIFADLPVGNKEKNMAITAYSALYSYNYGPDYIRTTGIMNTGVEDGAFSGLKAQEGPGNARYLLGTGKIWYAQAGLLLPKSISKKIRIQPIAAYTLKDLEALNESGSYYDIGSNFLIDAHHAKITLQYSNRPIYNNNKVFERAGEMLLQFQIYL